MSVAEAGWSEFCTNNWFGSFGWEGRGGDILNFYIWFNFLTRGDEGR
jgi:hypothetical protein